MNGRQLLMEDLRKQLPRRKYRILDPVGLQKVQAGNPVVMVVRVQIEPAPTAPTGHYRQEFDIWVIEPKQLAAEDALDDALEDVITAIDGGGGKDPLLWVAFESAERSVYTLNTEPPINHPAYRIRAVGVTKREEA